MKTRTVLTKDYRAISLSTYRKFCTTYPDISVTKEQWEKVVRGFNYSVRDYILETGEMVKLPWGVGMLSVSKFKPRRTKIYEGKEYINMPIDWVKTRAAGKVIYNFNAHTDGYRYKWYWFRNHTRLYMSAVRFFKPSRDSSRKLATYLKIPNSKYAQLYKNMSNKFNNLSDQRESKGR